MPQTTRYPEKRVIYIGTKYDPKIPGVRSLPVLLGYPDDPIPPAEVERDLKAQFGKRFRLVPTSPRGGRVLEG